MLALLLVMTAVQAEDLHVPGAGVVVHVPGVPDGEVQPWGWTVGDATVDVRLSMRRADAYTDVNFRATPYQPLADGLDRRLVEWMGTQSTEDLDVHPGDPRMEEIQGLGRTVIVPASVRDNWMERDLYSEVAAFPVEAAGMILTATSSRDAETADAVLHEVLGMIEVVSPPLAEGDLPAGHVEAPAGYSLDLPEGWRALTEREAQAFTTTRVAGEGPFSGVLADLLVVDESKLKGIVFRCRAAADGTLEILDPARSPRAADNFRTFARVQFKGGRYVLASGTEQRTVDVLTDTPVQPESEGELRLVRLGTREAYSWRVHGKLYDDPVAASIFYTTWDDVGLTCLAVQDLAGQAGGEAAASEGLLDRFDRTMAGLRVADGELHPMPLSLRARYVRWWPWSNPALQLYWLPIPVLLVAGWMVMRD